MAARSPRVPNRINAIAIRSSYWVAFPEENRCLGNALMLAPYADLVVEVDDQLVPGRYASGEVVPESLLPVPLEVAERHALLLDPREVAEIEHTLAIDMAELDQVVVDDPFEMR